MSELRKENGGVRAATALKVSLVKVSLVKVSLVTGLALWAGPVMAGPPPSSPAVTVYACNQPDFVTINSFNSNDTFLAAPFDGKIETATIISSISWAPNPVTLHCATADACHINLTWGSPVVNTFGSSDCGLVKKNQILLTNEITIGTGLSSVSTFSCRFASSVPTKCDGSP